MTGPALPWRPEFLAALRMLARASEGLAQRGYSRPVLVGGGAVEFYTGSAIMTGDIDITTPVQPELEEELQKLGFVRPSGPGKSTRGWIHPDIGLGFEVVGSSPMGGSVPATRLAMIRAIPNEPELVVLSVEDMIADRMGQYASGTAREMIDQARTLFGLNVALDIDYLDGRIREESVGDYGVEDLEA
ncbi:hypothetical protein [Sphingomonas changbaiensis]|uniref:hypothetical protein n=1 Tax=Sphingomonas changbaiensis TaxID=529705 RepID=UPI001FE0BCB6|nr:hypothetical protein [Sphingomonas changbaiensis]